MPKDTGIPRRKYLQLTGAGLVAGMAGCVGDVLQQGTEITYTDRDESVVGDEGYPPAFNDWQEETVDDASERITVNGNLNDGRYEDIVTQVRAGDQPADVIGVDIVRLNDFSMNLDMLQDIGDFVDDLEYRDDFLEGLEPQFFDNVDGTTVGVPSWIDCSIMHYNVEHFEEAGLDHPPETWEEFEHAAEVLSEGEYPAIGTAFYGGLAGFFFTPFMWANGGGIFNEDKTECILDTQESIEALEFWVNLQDQGYTTDLIGTQWQDFHSMFASENVSMIFSNPGPGDLPEANEEMFENYYNTAVFPRPEDGEHSSFLGGNSHSIFTGVEGEKLEASKEFLRWLNTEDGMKRTQELGYMPARQRGYEIGLYAEEPWATYFEAAEHALDVGDTIIHPDSEALVNEFRPRLEEALSGESTPEDAMSEAADAINEML